MARGWVFTYVGPESITPFNRFYPQIYVVFSTLKALGWLPLSQALLFIDCLKPLSLERGERGCN